MQGLHIDFAAKSPFESISAMLCYSELFKFDRIFQCACYIFDELQNVAINHAKANTNERINILCTF